MSVANYLQHYRTNGFNFNSKVLSRYCLSLYTKPFVILSGISGTGKTKIAQLFETFVDEDIAAEPEHPQARDFGYIIMNVTDGVYNGDGRGNLKFADLRAVFEGDEIPAINARIQELQRQGRSDNITEPEIFTVDTQWGNFRIGIYLQRAGSPLLRVRFKSRRGEEDAYDSQDFIRDHFNQGDVLQLVKTGARNFRVASINNQEVRVVDQAVDRRETALVDNKLFVAVKSNWTDQTELFGYYNVLEEKYNLTPLLRFMLTAREHPAKPFFLILDEMNLSKVEHYFSDFLSCLESRMYRDGNPEQEEIHLHNYNGYANADDTYFDVIPSTVAIPYNLYVTGTVNIDETTYAFSPKVLDRANVLEFNEVSIDAYEVEQQNHRFTLSEFPRFGTPALATTAAYTDSPEHYKEVIKALLKILQPYNLHFGYRVINEMALFVNHSVAFIGNQPAIIADAIDVQIAQKILPKFSGAFGKLDEPLRKLIAYLANINGLTFEQVNIDTVRGIDVAASNFPESLAKLVRMYNNLIYNGFASFLE